MLRVCLVVLSFICLHSHALSIPRHKALTRVLNGLSHESRNTDDFSDAVLRQTHSSRQASSVHSEVLSTAGLPQSLFSVTFYSNGTCGGIIQNMQVYVTSCQHSEVGAFGWDDLDFVAGVWVYRYNCSSGCNDCTQFRQVPVNQCLYENSTLSTRVTFDSFTALTADVRNNHYMHFNEYTTTDPANCATAFHQQDIYARLTDCLPINPFGSKWQCNGTHTLTSTCANDACGGPCTDFTWSASVVNPACIACAADVSTCSQPPSITNGVWGPPCDTAIVPIGQVCTLTCADGYSAIGNVMDVICTGANAYLGIRPQCVPAHCAPLDSTWLAQTHHTTTCIHPTSVTGETCTTRCAPGYYNPAVLDQVGDIYEENNCTATGPGTSAWTLPTSQCIPFSSQFNCSDSLLDRLDILGDPPILEEAYVLTCSGACSNGSGEIFGYPYYTLDSDLCLAARHSTGVSVGSFNVRIILDLLNPPELRQTSFQGSLRYGVTSLTYNAPYPIIFNVTVYDPQAMPPSLLMTSFSSSTTTQETSSANDKMLTSEILEMLFSLNSHRGGGGGGATDRVAAAVATSSSPPTQQPLLPSQTTKTSPTQENERAAVRLQQVNFRKRKLSLLNP